MAPRRTKVTVKVPTDSALIAPGADTPSMPALLQRLLAHLEKPAPSTAGIIAHPSSPFAYVTAPFDVDLLAGGRLLQPPSEVLLMNEGPAALNVTLHGRTYTLAPWDRHVYPCEGAATLHVAPVVLTNPLPPSPSSALLVSIAPQGSTFPGVPTGVSRHAATYSQTKFLGSVTTSGAGFTSKSFPLPTGTVAVGYAIDGNGGVTSADTVIVQGDQTLIVYRTDSGPGSSNNGPPVLTAILVPLDTSVTVSAKPPAGLGPITVDVFAWTIPVATLVQADPSLPIPVTFNINQRNFTAQAAPWQAPQKNASQETSDGLTHAVIPAVAGENIYIFGWELEIDGAAANRAATLQVVGGVGGTRIAFLEATNGQISGYAGGLPLGVGARLDLVTTALVGENARAFVGYSQF